MTPISIIIPAYNIEEYVSECIKSILPDVSFGAEIIIVDDGSTDNTGAIAKDFADKNPENVKYYLVPHAGLSMARNFGITKARGEYVGFADGDDYVAQGCFFKAYTEAKKHDADMAVFDWAKTDAWHMKFSRVTEGILSEGISAASNSAKSVLVPENLKKDFIKKCQPYAWSKIYKKSFLDANKDLRYPVGKIYEDIPVTFPLLFLSEKTVKINECLYYHVDERSGAITNKKTEKVLDIFDSLKTVIEFFKTYGVFYEYRNALCYICLRHTFARFMDFFEYDDKKLKEKILDTGLDFLHLEFPDWKRHNDFFYDAYHNKIVANAVKSRFFWEFAIRHKCFFGNIISFKRNFPGTASEFLRRSRANRNYYVSCTSRKIKKDTYLFESFWGREVTGAPFAICAELVRKSAEAGNKKNPIIYFVTDRKNKDTNRRTLDSAGLSTVRLVNIKSLKYNNLLATAEYLVNNVTFAEYFIRRPEQKYLNTWHGTPLKTLGKSEGHSLHGLQNTERNFLQANLLIYPNEYTKDIIFRDYNLEMLYTGKYMIAGYPQNDVFLREKGVLQSERDVSFNKNAVSSEDKASLMRQNAESTYAAAFNIAYMPTWREENCGDTRKSDIVNILKQFDSILKDNQKLFVKLHQYDRMRVDFRGFKHIFSFPSDTPAYEFLSRMDALITDYSSVMFDFMASRRPIALFVYDKDKYLSDRGCYIDLDDLLFKKAYNFDEMREILSNDFAGCAEYRDDPVFMRKFCGTLRPTSDSVLKFLQNTESERDGEKTGPVTYKSVTDKTVSAGRETERQATVPPATGNAVTCYSVSNRPVPDFPVTDCSANKFVLKDVYVVRPDREFEKNIKALKDRDPARTIIVFDGEPGDAELKMLESITSAPFVIAGRFMHVRGMDAVRLNKMFEREEKCEEREPESGTTLLTHAFSRETERVLPNITIKSVNVLSKSAYGDELKRAFEKSTE